MWRRLDAFINISPSYTDEAFQRKLEDLNRQLSAKDEPLWLNEFSGIMPRLPQTAASDTQAEEQVLQHAVTMAVAGDKLYRDVVNAAWHSTETSAPTLTEPFRALLQREAWFNPYVHGKVE